MTDWLVLIFYLLFSASGLLAVVKFFTMPRRVDYAPGYENGLDVSWCEIIVLAIIALLPLGNVALNLFWFSVLLQWIKRRPLIMYKPPKCPVAVHGRKAKA